MQCSCTTLFIFTLALSGSLLCCIAGVFALEGTLFLLESFGPDKNRGNPALDDAPDYWLNPQNGKYEARNYNKRGNFVPQAFKGIQIYLTVLGAVMAFNCILFLLVATRSKKVVNNRAYKGKRNSLSCIGCTGWLAGYSLFFVLLWLVMVGFAVLPLVEYVITMQRCWDLNNEYFSSTAKQAICIDLVQYGLVFFKETSDSGYALICGPGGNYDPPRGDLEQLCLSYYPNFCLYLTAFIGACVALLGMVFFAMRFVSIFVYLKIRRYENPAGPPRGVYPNGTYNQGPGYIPQSNYDNSVANPNYEQNVPLDLTRLTSHAEVDSYVTPPSETTDFTRRYEDERSAIRNSRRRASRSPSFESDYPVPPYPHTQAPPSYQSSRRRHRENNEYSRRHQDSKSDYERRGRDRRGRSSRRSYDYDSDRSSNYNSSGTHGRSRSPKESRSKRYDRRSRRESYDYDSEISN